MSALIASAFVFIIISVGFTALGFKLWAQPQTAVERVMSEVETAHEKVAEPSLSFRDIMTRIGNVVPTSPVDASIIQKRMLAAGIRNRNAVKLFYGIKGVLAVVLTLVTTGMIFGLQAQGEMTIFQVLAGGGLGWMGPNMVISRKAKKRQASIRRGLPNALDMLVICVESGLGLDQAIMQVSKELQIAYKAISDEFAVMNLEIRAGIQRIEAMHNLAERVEVDEMKKMVGVLVQADKFGTSISATLKSFSDYIRVQMRQEAEEKAAKIGVKLVFPIFFFILPALFVVTVGPMLVRVMRDFLPAIMGA